MSKMARNVKKVYFAGKVTHGCWRSELFNTPRIMSEPNGLYEIDQTSVVYVGPYAFSCDHGCYHYEGTHGLAIGRASCVGYLGQDGETEGGIRRPDAVKRCLSGIDNCDFVVCYISSPDCYGTLVELGYASARNKPILLFVHPSLQDSHEPPSIHDELWFSMNLPLVQNVIVGEPYKLAIERFIIGSLEVCESCGQELKYGNGKNSLLGAF